MPFLPFFQGTHGNHITPRVRASCSSTSDDGNATATGTPASAAVHFVIKFGYKNFKQEGTSKRSADCKVCSIKIKGAGKNHFKLYQALENSP